MDIRNVRHDDGHGGGDDGCGIRDDQSDFYAQNGGDEDGDYPFLIELSYVGTEVQIYILIFISYLIVIKIR